MTQAVPISTGMVSRVGSVVVVVVLAGTKAGAFTAPALDAAVVDGATVAATVVEVVVVAAMTDVDVDVDDVVEVAATKSVVAAAGTV